MMKTVLVVFLMISLVASTAWAAEGGLGKAPLEIGVRAGMTFSPDQFHFGADTDLGVLVGPMRVVPNIEIGLGNSITVLAFNGDLVYDLENTPFSVGGELGLIRTSVDLGPYGDASNTDLGLSVLGDYHHPLANGKAVLVEAKLGLTNAPDFKVTVGYNFF